MKDYYQILGIGDRASQEEIHDRWLELTGLFPPGSEGGSAGNARIAEINEAYQTLKTPNLKFEYDLRRNFKRSVLRHLAYHREKRKIRIKKMASYGSALAILLVIGSFTLFFETPWVTKKQGSVGAPENTRFAGPHPPLESEEYEKFAKLESHARFAETGLPALPLTKSPREVEDPPRVSPPGDERELEPMKEASATAVPDAEASKEVTRIVPREPSGGVIPEGLKETPIAPPPEIERKPEPMREASATAVKRAEERAGPAKDAFPESSRKELTEAPKKIPAAPPPEAKRKPEPTWEASTTAVKRPEESGGLVKDALLEPSRKEGRKAPRESPAASPLEAKRKSDPVKEIPDPALKIPALPTREAKAIPLPPNKTAIPEAAKIPTSSLGLPAVSRESEVKQFLAGYTDRYNRKDIEGFLSFFSPKAVQNQKDDIEKIRKVYASFFQQNEELRYTVRNVKIEPHKDGLQVMGDYELEGILKKGRERKVWRGQVRWVLMKDKETLKVLSLDYQPQKSRD